MDNQPGEQVQESGDAMPAGEKTEAARAARPANLSYYTSTDVVWAGQGEAKLRDSVVGWIRMNHDAMSKGLKATLHGTKRSGPGHQRT